MTYHDNHDYLTKSALDLFCTRPSKYYATYITKELPFKKSTPAMDIGSVCHAIILEGKLQSDLVMEYLPACLNKNGGLISRKAKIFSNACRAAGCYAMKSDTAEQVRKIIEKCKDSPIGEAVKAGQFFEQTFKSSPLGVPSKCKPDIISFANGRTTVYDLKFCNDASPQAFARSAKSFRYWLQDAHYCQVLYGLDPKPPEIDFAFIACETQAPYAIQVYRYDPQSRASAVEYWKSKVKELERRKQENDWRDDWDGTLVLAPWECETMIEFEG